MFVVKYRNGRAAGLKNVDHFLKPFVARVKLLAFFIPGVVSVFGDDDHSVHREAVGSESQRVLDGVELI